MRGWLERDVQDRGKYGRLLRYVWIALPSLTDDASGIMANAAIVESRHAQARSCPSDVAHDDLLRQAQRRSEL